MTTAVVMYIEYCRSRTEVVIVSKKNYNSVIIFAFQRIATDKASDKVVMMPTGVTTNASAKALHPNTRLKKQARELDILPELKHNSLLSVCKLSDAGYTTNFHSNDGGVTVHWADDIYIKVKKEAILQG